MNQDHPCGPIKRISLINRISPFSLTALIGALFLSACSNMTVLRTRELRAVGDSVQVVGQRVNEVQRSVDELNLSQGGTSSKMRADLTAMLGDLKEQISRLQAEIDETQHRLGQLSAKMEHLDQRKIVVVGGDTLTSGMDNSGVTPGAASGGKGAPQVKVVDGLDLEHVFNQAREDYVRGKYDLSYSGFKTVYEKDAGGSYKELALYWMGECLFKAGKGDKALEMYERAVKENPKGNRTCSARFKIGLIHHEAKSLEKRDAAWEVLIKECPSANETGRAQALMQE
jgi:TolA-binding protein